MRVRKLIKGVTQKAGSLLSTLLVILTLFMSLFAVAEAHEAPHETTAVAVVVAPHISANCHAFVSCRVCVVPSEMAHLTMELLHRLRFLWADAIFLTSFNPVFDTPPPRV